MWDEGHAKNLGKENGSDECYFKKRGRECINYEWL